MRRSLLPLALALLGACTAQPAGDPDGDSSDAGDETAAAACESDGVPILDACYHSIEVSEIAAPSSAVAADFDADGTIDVVTICSGAAWPLALCRWSPDLPVLRLDVPWLGETSGQALHAADFDADGAPDLLAASRGHFAVFGLGPAGFTLKSERLHDFVADSPADSLMFPALPIDIDRDGQAEVVTGGDFSDGFRVWRYDAPTHGWVTAGPRHPLSGCGELKDGRVGDLDHDGFPELVAFGSHNDCGLGPAQPDAAWDQIRVYTGDGDAHDLVPGVAFAAELAAARLDIGEFTGDAHLDLIVADNATSMMMFAGKGDGSFAPPLPLLGLAAFAGTGPLAADFDGDGVDEIVVEHADQGYRLLVGSPMPASIALPGALDRVLLAADLDLDAHADLARLTGDGDAARLVLTRSAG